MTRSRQRQGSEAARRFDYHEANAKYLLAQPGCPVCAETLWALDHEKTWLLAAGYSEEGVQSRFCSSGGYCLGHAEWLASSNMPHALTRLYRELTAATL